MSDVQQQVPADHPMMRAWTAYTATDEYANTKRWATNAAHTEGSLWAAFVDGWNRANSAPSEVKPVAHVVAATGVYDFIGAVKVEWTTPWAPPVGTALYAAPSAPASPTSEDVVRLVKTLEPFAAKLVDIGQDEADEDHFSNARSPYNQAVSVKVGDIRRAAAAIAPFAALVGGEGAELSGSEVLERIKNGALLFLDGRNEHGSHVLASLPQGLDVSNDTEGALEEQAEAILARAEALGFQIGSHVWGKFSWVREEYHHGYWEFVDIDADLTRLFHATFPGLDGIDPASAAAGEGA